MADDGSMGGMRGEANAALLETAFLYGANAPWIEEMQARYADDPTSVPPQWRSFFAELGDDIDDARKNAKGASWKRSDWPPSHAGEVIAAFDGQWPTAVKAVEQKIKTAPRPLPQKPTSPSRPAIPSRR